VKGTVIKSTGSWYAVLDENGTEVVCRIKGKFRMDGIKSTNPVAVGDHVEYDPEDGKGVIHTISPRKNYIIRRSTNLSKQSHIIAANIDRAYLVVTLVMPKTSTGFIDRFLATAEAYRIPVTILFNKKDMYVGTGRAEVDYLLDVYQKIGYECFCISAFDAQDVSALKERMKGKVNLFSGHSGVGKTTLVNHLDDTLLLKTSQLSDAHDKGKHTTTFAEMFRLSSGGFVIDTPGLKEFGLFDIKKEELSHFFPDIFKVSSGCKFNTCMHINEPKCAVIAAVEKEEIAPSRYYSYLGIVSGEELQKEYDD